jgi:hypothetical protein
MLQTAEEREKASTTFLLNAKEIRNAPFMTIPGQEKIR